jgi:hypothetical protein
MSIVVYLVSAIAGIYGLMWLVFTFVDPPSSLYYYFRSPSWISFLPGERAGRFGMFLVCSLVAFFASYLVSMFAF